MIGWIEAISALVTAIITLGIAIMVHRYTKRKDKASIIHDMWRQQQDWNLAATISEEHHRAADLMVYGGIPKTEKEKNALMLCMFFFLNRLNHIFDAYDLGILTRKEFEKEAQPTLKLLAGQKKLLAELLQHRGYGSDFGTEIMSLIIDVDAPPRIQFGFEKRPGKAQD